MATSTKNGTRRRGLDRERMVLELKRASGPAVALLALVVASIVCAVIIFKNDGVTLPWNSTYDRQIALDNAKGIVPDKQTVRLAGVTVGRITGLKLVAGRPVATISLDPQYGPLYNNAQIRVRPETPLDDMYIDIVSRGTPSAGQLGANQILPAQRTQVPVDISSVLNVFNTDTRSSVKASIDALGAGLGPQGDAFKRALVELAPFLAAAKQVTYETSIRQTETARLIHNFGLVTTELGRRDVAVRQLVSSGASTLTELGGSESSIQALINQLPQTMSQLESTFTTLRATENHLDPAFGALQPVAAALPAGLRGLRTFGAAATPAFAKLDAPLPALNSLVRSLRPTAAGLNHSFASLAQVPRQLNYVTQLVVPCEPALGKFFQNTLSLGKFQSNLSVILRGETVAGLNSYAGTVHDETAAPSCAPGGP
jgi:ABC-type transporter Mla subunit MlaD